MKADELEQRLKNALIYGTSHPEAYMTKVDELWYQFSGAEGLDGSTRMVKADFLAALAEYGEHVKSEAVKVCRESKTRRYGGRHIASSMTLPDDCAAAIEKMPLP